MMAADQSHKGRALAFALGAGALAFLLCVLGMLAWPGLSAEVDEVAAALSVSVMCGVLSWAAAERAIAVHAEAIDAISERLEQAAAGDIVSPSPPAVGVAWPGVAEALDMMFARMRRNLDRVNRLAFYDPVTGLPNRAHFRETAACAIEEAVAGGERPALLFVDLDGFKLVNDRFGHAAGDRMLAEMAARLREVLIDRDGALPARLAGDEFIILLTDGNAALALAEAVVEAAKAPATIEGQAVAIGASVGVALWPDHGRTLPGLMGAADRAMYQAKAAGRGRACLFDGIVDQPGRTRRSKAA
ncbi:GGDEF domain-containing protein [Sphingomonas sp. XMGL2]|uniref:GGDEF domain-containing protein n=2 Tax=Sphingomonas quercus TaxID=2842451 RepID=A0ABS6BLN9_9SPHN|nr:GGDEF domain-containing protein [Sphingomonas quercus]